MRRRALAQAGAAVPAAAQRVDQAAFLGVPEAELTPAVRGALSALTTEIADLRSEVARLKSRLSEVEGLADRDALTPLLNRRAFVRELSRIQTFAQRYGSPASLVYFDLDDLKGVNDRLGHAAGDAALVHVAEMMRANLRESDAVGRLGGDEFGLLMLNAGLEEGREKARKLAAALEEAPFEWEGRSAGLGGSFGVRAFAAHTDPEVWLAEADAAMWVRKKGR